MTAEPYTLLVTWNHTEHVVRRGQTRDHALVPIRAALDGSGDPSFRGRPYRVVLDLDLLISAAEKDPGVLTRALATDPALRAIYEHARTDLVRELANDLRP